MTDAILSFAVETIGKLLIEEAHFLQGLSDQVRLLHEDLKRMEWFLKYADTKQSARDSVQQWVSEFRVIAYEASDLVEDYTFRNSSRRKEGFTNTLKKYAGIFSDCHTNHQFVSEIQSLRTRISNLTKNFGEYGITPLMEEQGSSSMQQQQLRRTYSFVVEEDVVRLENDVETLVKYLLNEGEVGRHKVVSIYGMGGLGKTTLARKVYHNPKLKQYFNGFAWICVSQQWQAKEIFRGILAKLTPEEISEIKDSTEEELAKKLHQVLQDRRCLIVIDDIWSRDAWDCIKHAFPISEEGSKILLTTRKKDVALHIDSNGHHHQPQLLDEKQSWELLRKKSLKEKSSEGAEDYHKLEELGEKMVKHCGGLPLAVVVLGGILKTKKSLSEWIIVHENIKSYLGLGESIGEGVGEVPRILAFSYYDLPYQLKPCFLYLGKFKEDSDIEAERLYQLWMAEGMVLESDRIGQESTMNVAERYLEELAQRSMVKVELHDDYRPAITKFKSCRLHDLMRDLCLIKAKEENFFKVDDFQQITDEDTKLSADSSSSFQRFYRLVIRMDQNDISKYVPPQKEQAKHIRSFMFLVVNDEYIGTPLPKSFKSQFKNFKMLRVLVVEDLTHVFGRRGVDYPEAVICYQRGKYRLMDSIGNLIHLRYLGLRGSPFYAFPSSFGNLRYLETLDLREADIGKIPDVLWKMEKLRHVYIPFNRLHVTGSKLRFDGLSKLEILESFDTLVCDSKSLSKLNNLRVLKATVNEELEDLEQIINHISNLNHLCITKLVVRYCDFRKNSEKGSAILERMLFCKNLHELMISSTLSKKLPHYQPHFSPGLCELKLYWSKIEEDPMATLEMLPNLRILVLEKNSFVGKEMICHALGFPLLRILQLTQLPNLENWQVDEGAMPKLKYITINECKKLDMIPDELMSITALKEIQFWYMPQEFEDKVEIFRDQIEKHYGGKYLGPSIFCSKNYRP